MFCVKCGKEINEGQQFCTNCGQHIGEKVVTEENNEGVFKDNKSFEEKSAEIVSGVKDTVSSLAEKGAEFADKVKHDEKVNQVVNKTVKTVKSNKNTLIIGGVALLAVVLVILLFASNISSPKKALKGYFSGLKNKSFSKVVKYTGLEQSLLNSELLYATYDDEEFDKKDAKKEVKEQLEDMKDNFEDEMDDVKIELKKIELIGKTDTAAAYNVKYTVTIDGDRETDEDTFYVSKVGNEWIVNDSYSNLGY